MNSNVKTAIFWVILICVAVLLWVVVQTGKTRQDTAAHFHSVPQPGRGGQS